MKKFFTAAILLFMTGNAAAQEISPEVDEGISSVKQRKLPFNVEARTFDAAPEFIFKYKDFSVDYVHSRDDFNFVKVKADREIFSLMGTGLEWNVALNAVDSRDKFYCLPSVGINFYMRIRPRMDIYLQFSGLPLGRRAHFTDFESGIKYFPQKNFSISAGWRHIDFKLRRGGDVGDFALSGFFAGVRYDF